MNNLNDTDDAVNRLLWHAALWPLGFLTTVFLFMAPTCWLIGVGMSAAGFESFWLGMSDSQQYGVSLLLMCFGGHDVGIRIAQSDLFDEKRHPFAIYVAGVFGFFLMLLTTSLSLYLYGIAMRVADFIQ